MILDPKKLTQEQQLEVVEWLHRNGCRHLIAMEPIVVRGGWARYVALCRNDPRSLARIKLVNDEIIPLGVKRLRIRYPLHRR